MFKDCGADFMREFLYNCQDNAWGQIVDNGVQLIKEGEIGHSMYIIHRGSVTVDLKGTKVATLGAGDIAGELQLLGVSRERTATVTTNRISHVFEIKASAFVSCT